MDMDLAIAQLRGEMETLEMEIRARGFILSRERTEEDTAAGAPRFADTHVGYFGIWE